MGRGFHPPWRVVPNELALVLTREITSSLQLDRVADFQVELFPLHSPLLRESLLVSFPPLNYMLKFGGYSYKAEIQLQNERP